MPFLLGANLPWLSYGGDFGSNHWHPHGGVASRGDLGAIADRLSRLRAAGARVVRWFLFCDGRAGVRYAADGMPARLDDAVFRDLDAAFDLLDGAGLHVQFSLLDFLWCRRRRWIDGVQTGGRAGVLADPHGRAALIRRVLAPVWRRYASEPLVWSWDVMNEPEWGTFGLGTLNPLAVDAADMHAFLGDAVAALQADTMQPVTVGIASLGWVDFVRDLGLDFYAPHWYDRLDADAPLDRPVASWRLGRPVILGELPTRGSTRDVPTLLATAHRSGYAGALPWSVFAEDAASDGEAIDLALAGWEGAGVRG